MTEKKNHCVGGKCTAKDIYNCAYANVAMLIGVPGCWNIDFVTGKCTSPAANAESKDGEE